MGMRRAGGVSTYVHNNPTQITKSARPRRRRRRRRATLSRRMARHRCNADGMPRSWRRVALAAALASTAGAWSPSSLHQPQFLMGAPTTSTSPSRPSFVSPLASTAERPSVDETYYNPRGWSNDPIDEPTPPLTPSSTTTTASTDTVTATTSTSTPPTSPPAKITLTRWLSAKVQDYPELRDMESLHLSIQMACKTISNLIQSSSYATPATPPPSAPAREEQQQRQGQQQLDNSSGNARFNSMKRLDQISKNVLQNALRFTGRLRVVEAPRSIEGEEGPRTHQPGVTIAYALDSGGGVGSNASGGVSGAGGERDNKWGKARRLAACFDPLDGSGNADAAICTGTVFGVYDADAGFRGGETPDLRDASSLSRAVLQPGSQLLAAGYCLYSSTTMLVFTLGGGTHGFTLDKTINEFVLTHPNMMIPRRGNIYSCNESYSEGWDGRFREYLRRLKTGRGETGIRYTQRYVGSMVGDVHRTLMYGGIFCCPADNEVHPNGNLQLVYKSAPMAYILEHAGGKATNGKVNLLDVQPNHVHERSPSFMGSPDDMDELSRYTSGL